MRDALKNLTLTLSRKKSLSKACIQLKFQADITISIIHPTISISTHCCPLDHCSPYTENMFPNIGVDLLHLPRLASLLTRRKTPYLTRFARRILTSDELATFHSKVSQGIESADVVRWLGVRYSLPKPLFFNFRI
jgi:hypothetical protein